MILLRSTDILCPCVRPPTFAQPIRRLVPALGLTKNTEKISWEGINAIPDAITSSAVYEVKDVAKIYLTRQLEAIGNWARENGKEAILLVSEKNEHVSRKVDDLFEVVQYP